MEPSTVDLHLLGGLKKMRLRTKEEALSVTFCRKGVGRKMHNVWALES